MAFKCPVCKYEAACAGCEMYRSSLAAVEAERDRLAKQMADWVTDERDALKADNSWLREALWLAGEDVRCGRYLVAKQTIDDALASVQKCQHGIVHGEPCTPCEGGHRRKGE